MGVEPARKYARRLLDEALDSLEQADLRNGALAELGKLAVERGH